jgi:hypothetical protein
MAESADAADLKSAARKGVRVRPPLPAPSAKSSSCREAPHNLGQAEVKVYSDDGLSLALGNLRSGFVDGRPEEKIGALSIKPVRPRSLARGGLREIYVRSEDDDDISFARAQVDVPIVGGADAVPREA